MCWHYISLTDITSSSDEEAPTQTTKSQPLDKDKGKPKCLELGVMIPKENNFKAIQNEAIQNPTFY